MHGRRAQNEAAVQKKTDHTWSINSDPSGAVSQIDQLHTLIKNTEFLFTGYHPGY